MRQISILPEIPKGFDIEAARSCIVFLDGELMENVVAADEETGTVWVLVLNPNGEGIRKDGKMLTTQKRGVVIIDDCGATRH